MMQTLSITEKLGERLFPSLRERRVNLERELDHDRATNLANRAAFEKARATAEKDRNINFIVFDCNYFKTLNDICGHVAGDEILFQIAAEIKLACFAFKARAFRFGGDEFVVLADYRFAARLRDAVERRVARNDQVIEINRKLIAAGGKSVSISGTIGKTFASADKLLQNRKQAQKNAR